MSPSIEDEIKQRLFHSEHQRLVINLLFTAHWMEFRHGRLLRPFGLTPPQFNLMRILRGQQPVPATIALLTERMIDKSSNTSRLVDKLEKKRLVKRTICPQNRRAVDVVITAAGLALLKKLDQAILEDEARFHALPAAEARRVSDFLDRLRDCIPPGEPAERRAP